MTIEVTKQSAYASQYPHDLGVTKQSAYASFYLKDVRVTMQTAYVSFYPLRPQPTGRRFQPIVN